MPATVQIIYPITGQSVVIQGTTSSRFFMAMGYVSPQPTDWTVSMTAHLEGGGLSANVSGTPVNPPTAPYNWQFRFPVANPTLGTMPYLYVNVTDPANGDGMHVIRVQIGSHIGAPKPKPKKPKAKPKPAAVGNGSSK
jgi:hypothetical protein